MTNFFIKKLKLVFGWWVRKVHYFVFTCMNYKIGFTLETLMDVTQIHSNTFNSSYFVEYFWLHILFIYIYKVVGCPILTHEPLDRFASNFEWGTEFRRTTLMFLTWLKNSNFSGLTYNGNTPDKSEFSSCELLKNSFFLFIVNLIYLPHNVLYILRFDILRFIGPHYCRLNFIQVQKKSDLEFQ